MATLPQWRNQMGNNSLTQGTLMLSTEKRQHLNDSKPELL